MMELVLEAEAALDRALLDWRGLDRWNHDWEEPAALWSRAVWEQASALGPSPIAPAERRVGERVAASPVFICGAPRSGTTLVRDLLDGHPSLAVLPGEGRFFQYFGHSQVADRESILASEGQKWLRYLANPNHQEPFWLLSRSSAATSPYVQFAQRFLAWSKALKEHPLAACAQAGAGLSIAACRRQKLSGMRRSVDKTPGYEFHLGSVWSQWAHAKVICLVRQPAEVAASYRRGLARTGIQKAPVSRMLRNLVSSYRAAWRGMSLAPDNGLLIVDYGELVSDRLLVMARIARFLEIDFDECLLEQSIAGRPAQPNSSFAGAERVGFEPGNVNERVSLAAANVARRVLLAHLKRPIGASSNPARRGLSRRARPLGIRLETCAQNGDSHVDR